MYRVLIAVAASALARHEGVVAVYLARGCAKERILPGVSDIDLVVVTRSEGPEADAVRRTFRGLQHLTGGLVDAYPRLVQGRETLERRWHGASAWQFHLHEGRSTWKLLRGHDVLPELLPLTEAQRRRSCHAEMNRWWLSFARALLQSRSRQQDVLARNVTCFKSVAELLNAEHALWTGHYRPVREAALDDPAMPSRVRRLPESRFLVRDDEVVEETLRFLVWRFAELWDRFAERPFLDVDAGVRQAVDAPPEETVLEPGQERRAAALLRHLERHWGQVVTGVRRIRSAFWDFDDTLFVIDVERDRLPTAAQLAELASLHATTAGALDRLLIFVRVGRVVFPVGPRWPRDLHRGLATPATTPDVALQLGDTAYWSEDARWYLADWRTNEQWPEPEPRKRRQLECLAAMTRRGVVCYPLTVPALHRAEARGGAVPGGERPREGRS